MNATVNAKHPARPRRVWPWLLGGLLLCLLVAGGGLAGLMHLGDMNHGWHDGVHGMLDGTDWSGDGPGAVLVVMAGLLAGGAALTVGLLSMLVVVLVGVPLALALALLGVALGVAAALFSVAAVAATLLLPLWLPLLLLWLLLRRKPAVAPAMAAPTASMAA